MSLFTLEVCSVIRCRIRPLALKKASEGNTEEMDAMQLCLVVLMHLAGSGTTTIMHNDALALS